MPQVDPRTLDYSEDMKSYFREVVEILTRGFGKSPDEARDLVGRYFSIDVDPLERALVMHEAPENVAADLANSTTPIQSPNQNSPQTRPRRRRQLAAS